MSVHAPTQLVQHPDQLDDAIGIPKAMLYRHFKPDGTLWEKSA